MSTTSVAIPTSYYPAIGSIYPNAIVDRIKAIHIYGMGWKPETFDCTRENLAILKERNVTMVELTISRIPMTIGLEPSKPITASFKIQELI